MFKSIISLPYQAVHALRSCLYSSGICKSQKLPKFTIAIGNYSFGGTGKTPMTIHLAKALAHKGFRVAILTRGYKSKAKNYPIILDSSMNPSVELTGDEALEMLNSFKKEKSPIFIVIDPSRYRGGLAILEEENIDVFILDDGLQHLSLEKDLNILLINSQEKGFLREFPNMARKKADYIIFTKNLEDNIGQDNIVAVSKLRLNKAPDPNKPFGVITAIGDPESFILMLKKHLIDKGFLSNGESIKKFIFPDHYVFDVSRYIALGINLICTAKDFTKIPEQYKNQVIVAELELELHPESFTSEIQSKINSKQKT